MSSIRGLAAALLISIMLATGARADNGLERFEHEVKPHLGLQKLTYRSGEARGESGFVLHDVVAISPPTAATGNKPGTVTIDKVTVEAIDFTRFAKDNGKSMPRFLKLKLEGVTANDAAAHLLTTYGVPNAPADIALDYRFDAAGRRLIVNKLDVNLHEQGRLTLSLAIIGFSDWESARESARLQSASIRLVDKGLVRSVVEASARNRGGSPESMVALGLSTIAGLASQQGPEAVRALDALASYIADWKAPKGPLTVTLSPARGTGYNDLGALLEPDALHNILGLGATYSGTHAGAAKAGPAVK